MKSKKIKSNVSATDLNTSTILGEFEGECADGRITNANGLDITDAVPVAVSVFMRLVRN